MNKATEEVYEFMFKDKIVNAPILTKEKIQEMKDKGSEITGLTGSLEEEQQLLAFMEQEDTSNDSSKTSLQMCISYFMYPKELELLARRYSYIWTVQDMPVMKIRDSGGS